MNPFLENLKRLGVVRLAILGATGLGLIGMIMLIASRLSAPNMALLYSDLELDDSGQIVAKLESMGVPYQLRGDGSQIFVPSDRALQLRVTLAHDGLPGSGSIGYEIFDKSGALGASSFVNDINRVRALEGELSRTIRTLSNVRAARVHIVLPRRELFSREKQEPSASIALRLKGSDQLGQAQVRAIQSLVAAAVPGLSATRVSVVDHHGNLLARGAQDGKEGESGAGAAEDMKRSYEQRLARTVEELVGRTIGQGKVKAEVTAEMDFDRVTSTAELFDPESQVVRSTQSTQEAADTKDGSDRGSVSVSENLPSNEAQNANSPRNSNTTSKSEEVVNYEISKTVKNHVHETGSVKRLSVAVLVDGKYANGTDGQKAYQPQDQATLDQITTLVKSAVGFDAKRGDTIEVVNMQFAEPDAMSDSGGSFLDGISFSNYLHLAETIVLLIVSLMALLLVVRPALKRLTGTEVAAIGSPDQPQLAAPAGTAQLAAPHAQAQALPGAAPHAQALPSAGAPAALAPPDEVVPDEMIDIQNIEGRVRASSVKKISEIVERHPTETANIIRGWMIEQT
ncbi:MAG: flagellar basal-body MS-ring/collar protein FliF [Alphaproteobacteria bacterium]